MANVAVASNAVHLDATGAKTTHFLRALGPFGPESLATFPRRLTTNRNSAYSPPLSAKRLAKGLLNFQHRQCSAGYRRDARLRTPRTNPPSTSGSAATSKKRRNSSHG